MKQLSTAITITDPLVKYQTLIKAGIYSPDPAQHRLARHLRDIYHRIKDYSPQVDYREKLSQVARITKPPLPDNDAEAGSILALRNHAIWRNPLFKSLRPSLATKRESMELTRSLRNYETAIEIDSPKGLFLSGEVGTGKSMLLDLLADGLPTQRKRRWHFNTFMLYTFAQLDKHRQSSRDSSELESEFSLMWMAKKLIDESPILFLDEFQMPDRAASKILSHLFIIFFQLGGVLVASSNRMPEELQKATGIGYAPSHTKGFVAKMFGGKAANRGELYGQGSDFANFLEVLKARCDFWQMEGVTDWRRREETSTLPSTSSSLIAMDGPDNADNADNIGQLDGASGTERGSNTRRNIPFHYHLWDGDIDRFNKSVQDTVGWQRPGSVPWQPSVLIVYGRRVITPRHYNGSVFWAFSHLVGSFGPADYITMASSYHTFIIDEVPSLTLFQKNEARRFITFLDALYEARCKLLIRAQSPPDDLFFPEKIALSPDAVNGNIADNDATHSETVAEVHQDQMSPFRPNISYYDSASSTSRYDPDQDLDLGLRGNHIDFSNINAFTGEDERFAYKRAISRLWQLCSAAWHTRTGDWWQPLSPEARHWEGGGLSQPTRSSLIAEQRDTGERIGKSVEIDVAGLSKWKVDDLRQKSE